MNNLRVAKLVDALALGLAPTTRLITGMVCRFKSCSADHYSLLDISHRHE